MQSAEWQKLNEWMSKERKCHVCRVLYTNRDSFGKWQCREHSGIVRNNRFTCCGAVACMPASRVTLDSFYTGEYRPPELAGCIRADHKERGDTFYEPYNADPEKGTSTIKKATADALKCIPEARKEIPDSEFYVRVERYDSEALKKLNK